MARSNSDLSSHELHVLHRISKIVVRGADFQTDLHTILEILRDELGMERGMLSVLMRESQEIRVDIRLGMEDRAREVRYLLGEGITGKVVEKGLPMAVFNIDEEPLFLDKAGGRDGLDRTRISYICVPVKYHEIIVGALSVDKSRSSPKDTLDHEIRLLNEVAELIASRLHSRQIEQENMDLRRRSEHFPYEIIGNSDVMRDMKRDVLQVADSSTSVLITGETGTGKGVVAREIHSNSPRKGMPLIRVHCGAIPDNLIESELFGHEKGAFTGATQQRKGRFEMAKGGTIFLDEIGELPLSAQVKLLHVLQEREFERVGGTETIRVNVRVIAATNRSLEKEVQEGTFRPDLFYRLNVFPIHVPPLKERGADILLLSDYFAKRFAEDLGKEVQRIDTPAIDMLMAYHWPGNVRELENTIERAVLLTEDGVIHGHHLPPSLQMQERETPSATRLGRFESLVQNYEKELIIEALKTTWGNQTEAARVLQTTQRVIQYKIKKLGIDYRRFGRHAKAANS